MIEDKDEWGGYTDEFKNLKNFSDIFLITYSGQIRRTTIPATLVPFFGYLERPGGDIEPGFLDRLFCEQAERLHCGYAEAALNFLSTAIVETDTAHRYYELMNDSAAWERLSDQYGEEMIRRARIWREKHNMWEADLPPSFD